MDLTIIIPVKNEENNISNIVESINSKIKVGYEILFIDDFSEDSTVNVIKNFQKENDKIKLIKNKV